MQQWQWHATTIRHSYRLTNQFLTDLQTFDQTFDQAYSCFEIFSSDFQRNRKWAWQPKILDALRAPVAAPIDNRATNSLYCIWSSHCYSLLCCTPLSKFLNPPLRTVPNPSSLRLSLQQYDLPRVHSR